MGWQRSSSGDSTKYWHWSYINARLCEQGCSGNDHFLSIGNILQPVTINVMDKGRDLKQFHQCSWHLHWLWSRLGMFFWHSYTQSTWWIFVSYALKNSLCFVPDNIPWEAWWSYMPYRSWNLLLHTSLQFFGRVRGL